MSYTVDPELKGRRMVPMPDKILVETTPIGEVRRDSGLFLPETTADARMWGTVRAIGSQAQLQDGLEPTDEETLRVGDRVLFGRYTGHQIHQEHGTVAIFLAASEIIAKLIPETTHG